MRQSPVVPKARSLERCACWWAATQTTHARCTEVFDAIGDSYDLIGPYGAGYVAKIAQVMLCYLNSVCLTEALLLGVKGGVDPAQMLDIIQHSTGRSYVADRYGPEILNGGYDNTFHLGLAKKDLHLALALADRVGASLPFTADVTPLRRRHRRVRLRRAAPHRDATPRAPQRPDPSQSRTREPLHDRQRNREVTADDFAAKNAGSFTGAEWEARVDLAAMYRLAAHYRLRRSGLEPHHDARPGHRQRLLLEQVRSALQRGHRVEPDQGRRRRQRSRRSRPT